MTLDGFMTAGLVGLADHWRQRLARRPAEDALGRHGVYSAPLFGAAFS